MGRHMNYYERHLGDYARDTAHLSVLEHGVYTLLLDRYYATEQPIPAEQAHRVARARAKDERAAVDAVLGEFFKLVDGAWRNARADAEIARYRDKRETARRSANARWKPSGGNCGTGADALPAHQPVDANASDQDADALRTHSEGNALQSPVSRHQSPDTRHQTQGTLTPPRSLRSLHPPADAGGFDDRGTSDSRPRRFEATTPPPPPPPPATTATAGGEALAEPAAAASPKPRAKPKPIPALPEWIPRGPWAQWAEVRERMRAPLTAGAVELAIRELAKLRASGHDPTAVIEQSVLRGWRGLFPIRSDDEKTQAGTGQNGGRGNEGLASRSERLNRVHDEREEREERERAAGRGLFVVG